MITHNKTPYSLDTIQKILLNEEKRSRLKSFVYGPEVKTASGELRELREKLRHVQKSNKVELQEKIEAKRKECEDLKLHEQKVIADHVIPGRCPVKITEKVIRGNQTYTTRDVCSMVISRIITMELARSYHCYPSNLNEVIEQVCALLDNGMAKVVIRADIKHFFENIPQVKLIAQLENDGFVSRRSLKYLKAFLFQYNDITENFNKIGLPRGMSFSSYLSEMYMLAIDKRIRQLDGVYFYRRYVDDIIIVANEGHPLDSYWKALTNCFEGSGLELHAEGDKKFIKKLDTKTSRASFDYLGYNFNYRQGHLQVHLAKHRFNKYKILIDALFEIYSHCANHRVFKKTHKKEDYRKDALHQLMERLEVLTGNGLLSGRKNYVATGVYYTNKFLTDTSQLADLDNYLQKCINDPQVFCPPDVLFNYGANNGYVENLARIKQRLNQYSFVQGFKNPVLQRHDSYSLTLHTLQKIYFSRV